MTFLIRNWQYALPLVLSVALVVITGLWRLEVAETKIKEIENKTLKSEIDTLQDTVLDREADIKLCESDKKLTENITNEHQRKISALNRQLNEFKQLRDPRNARCVPITR